jgi:hypothetical protein
MVTSQRPNFRIIIAQLTYLATKSFGVYGGRREVKLERTVEKAVPIQVSRKNAWQVPIGFWVIYCHNKNYKQRFEAMYVQKGHTSLDTELYIHIAALARTRGFR